MGLGSNAGEGVVVDDGGESGGGAGRDGFDCGNGGKPSGSVSCSICIETVTDNGDRSWAKLQCGHQFHLDCIGSAFNIKGAMQCPNCRKIEKGQWLYANGGRSYPEFNVDDWMHDEDLYDLSLSEMSFGVQWCPFGSLARLPSFEEGELSSTTYHELLGQNAIFSEHSVPSAHPCPYVAYIGPTVHPSSSNSIGSVSDSSSFNNHWNGPSVPAEVPSSYTYPAVDLRYHNWEHHSLPFSTSSGRFGSSNQLSNPPVSQRSARSSSDMPRSGSFRRPFIGHGSGARAGSSGAPSLIPPYPGSNARARDRVQALQAYYQQHPSNSPPMQAPIISGSRRSSGHRIHAQVGPVASSSDQTGGFYFIPSGPPVRLDTENPHSTRFHAWERDHLPPFSINQVDRDSGWGAFHHSAVASDPSIRSGSFRQRHSSERTPSQNHS